MLRARGIMLNVIVPIMPNGTPRIAVADSLSRRLRREA
jgi:hypothetical protein